MSYTKTIWVDDSTPAINANNLNKIEQGIEKSYVFKNLFNIYNAKMTPNTNLTFQVKEDTITINGSSTTETDFILNAPNSNKNRDGVVLEAGTYTASIKLISGSVNTNPMTFYLRKNDGTTIYNGSLISSLEINNTITSNQILKTTFTLNEQTRLYWIGYINNNQRTFDNLKLQFQIEENTDVTPYVPFVGYIVESGSNANGSYIKFNDGTLICTNTVTFDNVNIDNAWGALYTNLNYPITLPNFPASFINNPDITFSLRKSSGSLILISDPSYPVTTTYPGRIQVCRPTNATNLNGELCYIAIGRWK